ncbi:DUF2799 domain-containing protein [Polaromonas sp. CT11-55]|uniref:DUF2799 domain-containing protein n=1 Tax=Polaromonas sp. CT11-55 TaxID=3243045 RepID=UPI0039A6ADD4
MSADLTRSFFNAIRPLAVLLAIPALLAGCESLSPAECATADWRQLGVQDGSRGRTDRAADYYESCAKAGIAVNVAVYRAGRNQGLQSYCQPANALNEGLAGNSYEGVCPAPMDQNFRNIHGIAWREQDARKTLARLQYEQDQMQAELRDAKTAEDRKRTLREQLARSDRRIEEARYAVRDASYQLDRLRSDMRQRGQY